MKSDLYKIFNESACLNKNEMTDYLSGKLSDEKMRRVEMHTADCVMCADELEGLSYMNDPSDLDAIVNSINEDLEEIIRKDDDKEITSTGRTVKLKRIFAVAASVALLITAGFILNDFYNSGNENLADMQVNEDAVEAEESFEVEALEKVNEQDFSDSTEHEESSVTSDRKVISSGEESGNTEERIEVNLFETTNDVIEDKDYEEVEEEDDFAYEETVIADDEVVDFISEDIKTISGSSDEKEIVNKEKRDLNKKEDNHIDGFATRHVPGINRAKKEDESKYKGIKSSAMFSYDEKVYNEASQGFNEYLKYNPEDKEVIYKNGIANYYLKNYNSALNNFDKILSFGKSRFYEDAEWYKSQTLLKLNKINDAVNILKKIISDNGKYKTKAEDVLKQLE